MRTRLGSATRVLTVITSVVALAACATTSSSSPGGQPSLGQVTASVSAALPTPRTTTVAHHSFVARETAPVGALTGSDPRLVTVLAFRATSSDPDCTTLAPSARVVRETRTSIVIATFSYEHTDPANSGDHGCLFRTTGAQSLYARLPVHLRALLGRRSLIDASTGQLIGILDPGPIPQPSYVPNGYQIDMSQDFDGQDDYVSIRRYQRGTDTIEFTRRSIAGSDSDGHWTTYGTIHGSPAVTDVEDYEHCVDWSGTPGILDEVCSLPQHSDGYLGFSVLAKIARSIH